MKPYLIFILFFLLPSIGFAATSLPFTVNLSKAVTVDTTGGTPRIAINVGGVTRYANYASGTGTSALIFTYAAVAGDVDLDGITLTSPVDLNGGTMKDLAGNDAALTYTLPTTTGVKVNYPSLSMDFSNGATGRYTINGTVYSSLASFLTATGGSFTRASTATYFDSTGVMQTAASGAPRFDYDPVTLAARGVLIEEARINSLLNGNVTGSVAGTPGTMPTGWGIGGGGIGGLTQQIVGSGTENGIPYVDYKLSGTSTSGSAYLYFGTATAIPAAQGQQWASSLYIKLAAGSMTNASIQLQTYERNSGGVALVASGNSISLTSTLTRRTTSRTLSNAATAYVVPCFLFGFSTTLPVNFTLRIGGIQTELGSVSTSYIPTSSSAVARSADALSIPISTWYQAAQGTLMTAATPYALPSIFARHVELDDVTLNNRISLMQSASLAGDIVSASAGQVVFTSVGTAIPLRQAMAYKLNDFAFSYNNTTPQTDTAGTVPTGISTMNIGNAPALNRGLNGGVQKINYYPLRVADTQLQLLTQ